MKELEGSILFEYREDILRDSYAILSNKKRDISRLLEKYRKERIISRATDSDFEEVKVLAMSEEQIEALKRLLKKLTKKKH